jgi:hypothetical protein
MSEKVRVGDPPPQPSAESNKTRSTDSSTLTGSDRSIQGPDSAREISEVASWKLVSPVIIWFRFTQSISAQAVDHVRPMLSLDERARCDRFVFERDRRDFVAARALLRGVPSDYGELSPEGWKFGSEANGKPYLVDQSELHFNIAQTRGLVACATSR